jgi:hypothetical protein
MDRPRNLSHAAGSFSVDIKNFFVVCLSDLEPIPKTGEVED